MHKGMYISLLRIRNRFIYPNVCSIDDLYHPTSWLYFPSSSLSCLCCLFLIGVIILFNNFLSQYALSPKIHSSASSGGEYWRYYWISEMVPKWGPERKHGAAECKHIIWIYEITRRTWWRSFINHWFESYTVLPCRHASCICRYISKTALSHQWAEKQ